MPPTKKTCTPKLSQAIHSLKHNDNRANTPIEELRDFIVDEEKAPETVVYPRNPSLNPQSGMMAVKVINHYGYEVLRVYEVK